jgi:hypothetical protein
MTGPDIILLLFCSFFIKSLNPLIKKISNIFIHTSFILFYVFLCLCLTVVIVCYFLGNHIVLYTSRFLTVLGIDLLLNDTILCHKFPECNTVAIIVFYILFAQSG